MMLRGIQFISILCLMPYWVVSQTYQLTVSSETYINLSGGLPAVTQTWDDPEFAVPIGFTFDYYGQPISTLNQFATVAYPVLMTKNAGDTMGVFFVFGADLIDRGFADTVLMSPITYKTTGSAGHRIFTIEWKNAGFFRQYFFFNDNTDFVNFQMQLYQENGDIVYRFGPSNITTPDLDYDSTGAFVGFLENLVLSKNMSIGENLLLTGSPANPVVIHTYSDVYLDGTIPANTVYTFSREVSATNDPISESAIPYFSPNPTTDFLYINAQVKEEIVPPVYVYNSTGSVVQVEKHLGAINTNDLPAGIYQLQFQTKSGLKSQRVVVTR